MSAAPRGRLARRHRRRPVTVADETHLNRPAGTFRARPACGRQPDMNLAGEGAPIDSADPRAARDQRGPSLSADPDTVLDRAISGRDELVRSTKKDVIDTELN
jgi:hypothetical protein